MDSGHTGLLSQQSHKLLVIFNLTDVNIFIFDILILFQRCHDENMYGAGSWCWQCRHQESKKDWFNQVKNYPRIAGGIICQHPHRARLLEPVPGGGRQQERHQDSPGQGPCHQPAGGRRPGEAGGGQHLQHSTARQCYRVYYFRLIV